MTNPEINLNLDQARRKIYLIIIDHIDLIETKLLDNAFDERKTLLHIENIVYHLNHAIEEIKRAYK